MNRTVAIVGRPNVGKSRLFNRLARKRISIVHDQPGVTRDVISAEIEEGAYTLLDTGGIGYKGTDTPAALTAASEEQVSFAIETAAVILFVIDGLEGRGLVTRNLDTSDRRVWRIELTEAATSLVVAFKAIDAELHEEVRAGMSHAERRSLAEMLLRLEANVVKAATAEVQPVA